MTPDLELILVDGGNSSSLKLCFAVKEHVHLSCSSGALNIKKNLGPCLTFPRNPVLQKSFFFFFFSLHVL